FTEAGDYETALGYFNRAANAYETDHFDTALIKATHGEALAQIGRLLDAKTLLLGVLSENDDPKPSRTDGRAFLSLASIERQQSQYTLAFDYLDQAIDIFRAVGSDADLRNALAERTDLALAQGDLATAATVIENGFDGVETSQTGRPFRRLHDAASRVYGLKGDWEQAYNHQMAYRRLSDQAAMEAASMNVALREAEFQTAEQQLRIERLRNEKLRAAAELDLVRQRELRQRSIVAASVGLTVLAIFIVALVVMYQVRVRQVNERLRRLVRRLREEVATRRRAESDLRAARDKAEAADRTKSTFLASMSHELRTPMNGILGFTEVLLAGELTSEQREHIEIIDQASGSLLTLINDILDLSQLEAGKFNLHSHEFNLRLAVENAVKLMRARAQEKNITLAVRIDDNLPVTVVGDEDRLRQLLLNLISNAVKFTDDGTVVLRVLQGETSGHVEFQVQDTGIGIPANALQTLFRRFSQIDGGVNRVQAGSGLGLAICKELVAAMEGDISCTSEVGEGSIFRFAIPLIDEEPNAQSLFSDNDDSEQPQVYEAPDVLRDRTLILVDPADLRSATLISMLEGLGGTVLGFTDVDQAMSEAVRLLQTEDQFDTILISDRCSANEAARVHRRLIEENGVEPSRVVGFGAV
ncbi:MAG: ATP-binding protein, partial [Pseudomonadota bacterium]